MPVVVLLLYISKYHSQTQHDQKILTVRCTSKCLIELNAEVSGAKPFYIGESTDGKDDLTILHSVICPRNPDTPPWFPNDTGSAATAGFLQQCRDKDPTFENV